MSIARRGCASRAALVSETDQPARRRRSRRRREQIGNFQRLGAVAAGRRRDRAQRSLAACRCCTVATPQSRPRPAYPVSARRRLCHRLAGSLRASAVAHRGGGGGTGRGRAVPAARRSTRFRRRSTTRSRPGAACSTRAPIRAVPSSSGDLAGGGLALALALRARDAGESLPAAIVAMSPWTDLAVTGESVRRNARRRPDAERRGRAASRVALSRRRRPAPPLRLAAVRRSRRAAADADPGRRRRDPARRTRCAWRRGCARPASRCSLEIWPRMPHVFQSFSLDPAGGPPRDRPHRRLCLTSTPRTLR